MAPAKAKSPLADLLASPQAEHELRERLYGEYRGLRRRLFDELRQNHADIAALELLARTQTILDRVLFIAFAQAQQLLPPNTLAKVAAQRDPECARPRWSDFLAAFRSIDEGDAALDIPAYGGGLFRELAGVEALAVSDDMCAALQRLGEHERREGLSVDVLGHIFEQSIVDLESMREELLRGGPPGKLPSQRKRDGIFYSPRAVTHFLVRETLGRAMLDAWARAGGARDQAAGEHASIAVWEAYQAELRRLRVLDPACGSGVFLVAVLEALVHELERADQALAKLRDRPQTSRFELRRRVLHENLFGIDKNAESVEISKLALWLETAQRGEGPSREGPAKRGRERDGLPILDRNIRRGNSVVDDPRVDACAFDWCDFTPPSRAGFDVVLGNPPYVRHELLAAYKQHWSRTFRVYDGNADLFVYFFERGLRELEPGGRLGFIVSNKWLRGGYAERLRELLAREHTIECIVDFGHAPLFPDADAFPCIIVVRKQSPPPEHELRVTQFPREHLGEQPLASYVDTHAFSLPQRSLDRKGWSLEPPAAQRLLEKLRRNAAPLEDYASVKPYSGIKTGCNPAFLVDDAVKQRLCREHPGSQVVLQKYLRGDDIARWSPEWAQLWLILLKSSGDHDWPWSTRAGEEAERSFAATFPAIHAHLQPLRAQLLARTDQGRHWWELRSCAYYSQFEQPKILYQEIQFHPRYALDRSGLYTNNKVFFLPTDDPWLLACLNSPVMWWHNWRHLVHLKDEALSTAREKMLTVPIPRPSAEQAELIASHIETIVQLTRTASDATSALLHVLRVEWDIDKPGHALADFSALGGDAFVLEVKKRRSKASPRPTATALAELRVLHEDAAPRVLDARARIDALEREIATAVHDAYGLDTDDLALLRASAPPRMPFVPGA